MALERRKTVSEVASEIKPRSDKPKQKETDRLVSTGIALLNLAMTDNADGGCILGRIINFVGESSTGKALPNYEVVSTPNGFVPISSLKVGDLVHAIDGTPVKVLGVYPQEEKKRIYEFVCNDLSTVRSSEDHLWYTETILDRAKNRKGTIKTTKEIIDSINYVTENVYKRKNHRLPNIKPVQFEAQEVEISPYLLGVWLGDGSKKEPKISNISESLFERVKKEAPQGITVERRISKNGGVWIVLSNPYEKKDVKRGYNSNPFTAALRFYDLFELESNEIFIPRQYLINTVQVRKNLLAGLLDTDSEIGHKNKFIRYSTTSPYLANDIIFLVKSLGGFAWYREKKAWYYDKNKEKKHCKDCYDLCIQLPSDFELNMSVKELPKKTKECHRKIEFARYIGEEDCTCILVDHPSHMFLTRDFIPTHNTMIAETMLACAANDPKLEDYKLILDDAEAAHEVDTAYMFGEKAAERIKAPKYDDDDLPIYSDTIEQFFANVQRHIKEGEPFIYVLDSLDSLTDDSELKRADEIVAADESGKEVGGTYGMVKAKMLSQMLRTINANLAATNSLVVIISQVRDNIGAMGAAPRTRRAGGKALEFYCTHTVWLKKVQTLKKKVGKDELVIGSAVEADVKKNKATGKLRSVRFNIYYELGADDTLASVEFLLDQGILKKAGAYVEAEALGYENKMFKDALVKAIENDDKYDLLRELTAKAWHDRESKVSLGRKPRFR